MVAYKDGRQVSLVSRRGVDLTERFPRVAKAIASLPSEALVLDGEVAVFDQRLMSRFDLLSEPEPDVVVTPPVYVAFDVLYKGQQDYRGHGKCDQFM
jgi:bifunctional non-homologous end joining protein LigD